MIQAQFIRNLRSRRTIFLVGVVVFILYLSFLSRPEFVQDVTHHQATGVYHNLSSWALVVASLKAEDTTWISQNFPDTKSAVYVVDDPTAEFKVPQNKGHEAMVYLTYIIDHYNSLPDVCIFIHAGRFAEHNEQILDRDLTKMIKYLHMQHVARTGYMNLRCQWDHGCPNKHNFKDVDDLAADNETRIFHQAWTELFPGSLIPNVVAQPWGGQFAASRERIKSVSLENWIRYRQWLLDTKLHDYDSGRVWEYTWQYILKDSAVFCPAMDACYCDGYGICFNSQKAFARWWDLWAQSKELYSQYLLIKSKGGEDLLLKAKIDAQNEEWRRQLKIAISSGNG